MPEVWETRPVNCAWKVGPRVVLEVAGWQAVVFVDVECAAATSGMGNTAQELLD
jgi:hypothetical protein